MGIESLSLMHAPAAPHVSFGIFNWVWPNIAMWAVVIVIFFIGAYARIPKWMEMDVEERCRYEAQEQTKNEEG